MLLVNEEGNIIGYNTQPETKPVPFAVPAKWNGKSWEYEDIEVSKYYFTASSDQRLDNLSSVHSFDIRDFFAKNLNIIGGEYKKPKEKEISVLIPSYGKRKYVEVAIDSALNQTLPPYEVVVLDMEEKDIPSKEGVRIIKHDKINVSAARNYLVKQCKTNYFIFLDADDTLRNDFIEKMYKTEASVVGCACARKQKGIVYFDNAKYLKTNRELLGKPYRWCLFGNITGLLNKWLWQDIGGMREDLALGGEDSFFMQEIFFQGKWKIDFLPYPLWTYSEGVPNSLTSDCISFSRSTEHAMDLHASKYIKYFDKTFATQYIDSIFENYGLELNDALKMRLLVILWKIPQQDREDAVKDYCQYQKLIPLFLSSPFNETEYICKDLDLVLLYGRRFDLYVDGIPGTKLNKDQCYVNNPSVDLSLPLEELLTRYNIIYKSYLDK